MIYTKACQSNNYEYYNYNYDDPTCKNIQEIRVLARRHNLDGQNLSSFEAIICNN